MMTSIAFLDLTALLVLSLAIFFTIRTRKSGSIFSEIRIVILGLLLFTALYLFLLLLEWANISRGFEKVEDLIGALIPMLWAFVFYTILKTVAARDLQKSQERYRMLIETMNESFMAIDRDGRFTSVNQKMEQMLGCSKKELIGSSIFRFLDEKNRAILDSQLIKKEKEIQSTFELEWLRKDDSKVITHVSPQFLFDDKVIVGSFAVILDITGRKKTEEKLQKSEERYRQLFQNASEAIIIAQDGKLVFHNPMTILLLGYSSEAISREPFSGFIHPEDRQMVMERYRQRLRGEDLPDKYIFRIIRQDGSVRWVELSSVRIEWEGRPATLSFLNDTTKRKQAEDELSTKGYYLSKAQEIGAIGTWELDVQANILRWTDENYKIFGVPMGTNLNYELFLEIVHPDDREYINEQWDAALDGEPYDIEHRLIVGNQVKWVREKADIEFDEEGNAIRGIGVTQDITAKKRSEEQIKDSLFEKETLLQEIHHRVKNNMQVINSLLKLQAHDVENDQIKEILKESQNRIYAMAAVHETLHSSDMLSDIDLGSYLSNIASAILQTYSVNCGKVKLNTELANSTININQAYPLGLVVNELMSNALKYAFPGEKGGEIDVKVVKQDQEFELSVMDNGVGLPADLDWQNSGTLGFKLVRTLVESQLNGSIDIDNSNGTTFIIKFNTAIP